MYVRSIETTDNQAPSPIPVGAIAGGIAAGASLAVIVTLGWLRWGKRGSRRQLIHWGEARAETQYEVAQRRALPEPRTPSQEPFYPCSTERKIKFEMRSDNTESGSMNTVIRLPEVSKPRPLRSAKGPHSLLGTRDRYLGTGMLSSPKIAHKPSTVSSMSMYSTESGEEHQVRVPPNLILAATGGLNVDTGGDRRSVTSSNWGFLSRMAHGAQGTASRHSQASSRSAYTTMSKDSSGVPIGVAF